MHEESGANIEQNKTVHCVYALRVRREHNPSLNVTPGRVCQGVHAAEAAAGRRAGAAKGGEPAARDKCTLLAWSSISMCGTCWCSVYSAYVAAGLRAGAVEAGARSSDCAAQDGARRIGHKGIAH